MIVVTYAQWIKLANQVYNDYGLPIDDSYCKELDAYFRAEVCTQKVYIIFKQAYKECFFKLKYSNYL